MTKVTWETRRTGDIFLACVPSLIGKGIIEAELAMHPGSPRDFVPSHAGIVGFDIPTDRTVVEAWLDMHEDSVACINSASKYAGYEKYLEVWRPDAFVHESLQDYIKAFGPESYGVLNLFGFEWVAVVKYLTGKNVSNPVEVSRVCSQGVGQYLLINYQHTRAESWILKTAIRNLDPLALRLACLASNPKTA